MDIPKTKDELFNYFYQDRIETSNLRDELNRDLSEKRVFIIKDQRLFFQNIALASATLLGLVSAFSAIVGFGNTSFIFLFTGLSLHLLLICLVILHVREVLDADAAGLVSLQDRYGKLLTSKISRLEIYETYTLDLSGDQGVEDLLRQYFKEIKNDPAVEELKEDNEKLNFSREQRLTGKDQLGFFGELISFLFILGSIFVLLAVSGLDLAWYILTVGILVIFLLAFSNVISILLGVIFRIITFGRKRITFSKKGLLIKEKEPYDF